MCKIVLFIEIIVFYEMIVGNVSLLVFINIEVKKYKIYNEFIESVVLF